MLCYILGNTNYVALITGITCIIGLLLPTEGEQNHRVPDYLHLSVNFKLIFAFVLGTYWILCMCALIRHSNLFFVAGMVANIVLGL